MNILSVSGLHKSFGEHEVLKGISFALEQGETPVSYTHLTLPTKLEV